MQDSTAPEKRKKEQEKKQKKEVGERKEKRSKKPEPCKCVATVRHINTYLHDLQEVAVEKIYNFPELGGKVVELLEKAIHKDIYYPLEVIEQQLVKEEKLGKRDQLKELKKSQFCKARSHCNFEELPNLDGFTDVQYGSDSDDDDEANRLYHYKYPSTYDQ